MNKWIFISAFNLHSINKSMELGIYSFADTMADAEGKRMSPHQRIKELLEEIELAEQVGLDVYAVGEHHRPDFAVSSPATVLAAAAVKTNRIKLSSAVTVLSSDDPVRVFQSFATVDNLSDGRAEIMAGRGSFIESFPLFGYNLNDYDELFSEKLELLLLINQHEKINWKGKHRASINNLGVYPRPFQKEIPIWVAVGGTPQSVIRAGTLGLPMALAIIGGLPERFKAMTDLYKRTIQESGNGAKSKISINSHVFVGEDSQQAVSDFYPSYAQVMTQLGRERGWPAMTQHQFESMRSPHGSLLVGSVQQVIDKILYEYELFGNDRFLAQMSVGNVPHQKLLKSIELFGTEVLPAVKKATNQQNNKAD